MRVPYISWVLLYGHGRKTKDFFRGAFGGLGDIFGTAGEKCPIAINSSSTTQSKSRDDHFVFYTLEITD